MKQLTVFLFFLCVPVVLFAQQEFRIETEIKEVSLTDTTLINQIRNLIREQEKEDTVFRKGYGYITASISYRPPTYVVDSQEEYKKAIPDTVGVCYLTVSFMSMDKAENTLQDMYHPFYAYVDKRMVLISANDGCKLQFSEKSKQLLRNKVEPFLEKAVTSEKRVDGKKVVFKDPKSRTLLKINEQTIIYYLKYPLQKEPLPPVVIKKKWF